MAAPLWQRLSPGPAPATPSLLYRSAFAEECEALATALRGAGESHLPPSPTIETERLTPLCAAAASSSSSSFFSSFLTPQPSSGPPSRSPNRTYDGGEAAENQASDLGGGGVAPASPQEEKAGGHSPRLDLTFEWEPPTLGPADPFTSTPAPAWAETPDRTTTTTAAEEGGGDAGDPGTPSSAPGKRSAGKGRLPTRKKRRLSVGGAAAGTAPGSSSSSSRFPVPKGAPKGAAAPAAPGLFRLTGGKKQLHDETRNSSTEVHHEKKTAMSFQPTSQRTKKTVLGGSLACQGLKHQGENKPPRTKLPVLTVPGGPKTQKHPKEKEPSTESAQKQIITKRVSQGTGVRPEMEAHRRIFVDNETDLQSCSKLWVLLADGASQFVKCMVEVTSKV
ncbi:hypothetical protein JD844_003971 [Phrynosoma platyrhinos]|uniref:Uncharacterized protein n=1 Tax=Phrynosoma platyrhinos TaxID=52577 RepID=A0ABQ7TM78_PHRPL|nr:hypothetical protein JD844_003971 [Phrynosoma platyrhinos]